MRKHSDQHPLLQRAGLTSVPAFLDGLLRSMSHLHLRVFGKVSVCGYHLEQEGRGAEKEIPKLPEKFFLACLLVKDSIKSDI